MGLKFTPMRVITLSTLKNFCVKHKDADQPLRAWYEEAVNASWTQPTDIKAQYANASILKNRRVVFNIKGNDFRLVVAISYKLQLVFIKFLGTHAQYDKVDADTVEMQ